MLFPRRSRDALEALDSRVSELEASLEGIASDLRRTVRALDELPSSEKQLGKELAELRVAVAHGIEHTDRVESRIRATVGRAKRELEKLGIEHPGLEAEVAELRFVDGDQGYSEGVPPMPEDLEESPALGAVDFSAFPGSWQPDDIEKLVGG